MPNCNEKNNYKNIKKQGVSDWDQLDSVDTVVDSHTVTVWQPVLLKWWVYLRYSKTAGSRNGRDGDCEVIKFLAPKNKPST